MEVTIGMKMEIEIVIEMEMGIEMERSADLAPPPTYVFCFLFHKTQAVGFSFPIPKKSPAFGRTQSGHLSQLHKKKGFGLCFAEIQVTCFHFTIYIGHRF